jgi:eukaryotic-like serine/threonine-protein kinase
MGTVFEAEQLEPRRRVAIKLLREPLSLSEEAIGLFRRETQALARLRHPAIAMIHESGTTPEGLQYYAMELVPGVRLSDWMATRPLGRSTTTGVIRRRLAIFRRICAGVSYAHLHGVIHRDLKPSNVMVRADEAAGGDSGAEVKILDFGLALIQDGDVTAAGLTDPGTIRGTLAYMSPEQTGGNVYEIDSRSDVYGLGVILYELLTGRLPYEIQGKSPIQILAAVSLQTPPPPSVIWRELGWRVESDLETILLKALAKDPDERYQTVSALADDIGRFEAGLPIQARPPTLAYQVRKLVGRHRVAASLALALVAVLLGATVVTTVQRNRAAHAEAAARAEAAKAQAVVQFLERMLTSSDPYHGSRDVTVADVLDQAAREVPLSLAGQPDVKAAAHRALGRTYQGLGRFDQADEQLRLALAAARTAPEPDRTQILELTENLAELRWRQGRLQEADSIAGTVLRQRRALLGRENLAVASTLDLLGVIAYAKDELVRGDSVLRQAIALRARFLGANDLLVAQSQDNLASIRYEQGEFAAAETLFSASLAARRGALGSSHPDVAATLGNLAMTLMQLGRPSEAEPMYREALEANRKTFGNEHPAVAQSLNNFGMYYYRQGRYAEAEPLLRESVALNQKLLGRNNPEVATGLNNLALVALRTGRFDLAEDLFGQALSITARVHGTVSSIYAQYLKSLASAQTRGGKRGRAEATFRRAIEIQRRLTDLPGWELATTESMLGELYVSTKRYPEAERLYRESFPVIRSQFGDAHDRTRVARDRFVKLYEEWGKPALADSIRQLDPTAQREG